MTRRLDLDAIRIAAFLLLILYHVGMYYVSWDWHIKSQDASTALEPLMFLSSPWRLSLLFLVSGVATAFLFQNALSEFVRSRSFRLLVPLLFGMLVIVPPQAYFELLDSRYAGGFHDGYLAFWSRYLQGDTSFCDDEGCLRVPTWNHLWFVAYLWVYTLVAALFLVPGKRWADLLCRGIQRWLSGPGLLIWPVIWLALARITLVEHFPSTHALVDDWYNHAQYLPIFLLGLVIARSDAVWDAFHRQRWRALALAATAYGFIVWYFNFSPFGEHHPIPDALRELQRGMWALMQWSSISAILGFARGIAFQDGPVLRYLREAVFPIYILHQTVIIVVAWQFRPLELRPVIEGPLLAGLTLLICLVGVEIVRRVRWLRPLFGMTLPVRGPRVISP
jgi:surface polysaccharide O-acyltransferase-like enzyme